MHRTLSHKVDAVWRSHRWMGGNYPMIPRRRAGQREPFRHTPPIVAIAVGLFLVMLLVGSGPIVGAERSEPPAESCPCEEMTVANILTTGADGGCVDVPPAVTFTRESNTSVYIASRNLCTVSAPPNRKAEWTVIETDAEFEACRSVIREAADKLGVLCTDTYHPTPSREPTFASPSS